MNDQAPNYHREFLRSPLHATLALLTLGVGLASASLLWLIGGATAYLLGWIYLPDSPFFRAWVDRRQGAAQRAAEAGRVAEFVHRRQTLLNSLSPDRRTRYADLVRVCHDIETAGGDTPPATPGGPPDPRLRKLDELMWTCLRLLSIEQSLRQYLDMEQRENLPEVVRAAEAEVARLRTELETLKAAGPGPTLETRQRFLSSRLERIEVLGKRRQRTEEAGANLDLVRAEQDRLVEQVKLIRADAIATKNAETLTARIDATVEHLDQTNKWLAEMDEFKDLAGDLPQTDLRLGYQAQPSAAPHPGAPPVIEPPGAARARIGVTLR